MNPATEATLMIAAAPPRQHRPEGRVREPHRRLDVELEVAHLVLDVVPLERERQAVAGVVDEDLDRTLVVLQARRRPCRAAAGS